MFHVNIFLKLKSTSHRPEIKIKLFHVKHAMKKPPIQGGFSYVEDWFLFFS